MLHQHDGAGVAGDGYDVHYDDHLRRAYVVAHDAHEQHAGGNADGEHRSPVGVCNGVEADGALEEGSVVEAERNAGEGRDGQADPEQPVALGLARGRQGYAALGVVERLFGLELGLYLLGLFPAVGLDAHLLRRVADEDDGHEQQDEARGGVRAVGYLVAVSGYQPADHGHDYHAAEAVAAHDDGQHGGALVHEPVGYDDGNRRGAGEEGDQAAQGAADAQHPQALSVGVEQIVADQQQIAEDEQLLGAELGEQGFEEENGYNKRCGVGKGEVPGDDARAESGMGAHLGQHH